METIRLFRVFLSAPSDVLEEHEVLAGVLTDWNIQHGQSLGIRVELVHWRTHAHPATGKRPQSLINKQAFDGCDIVVGIFWRKFGTPTGRFGSGTEEELRRGIASNKSVLVYFARIPPPEGTGQPLRFSKIEAFKRKLGTHALYWEYGSMEGFEHDVRNHLAMVMQDLQIKHKLRK
jgi:hypothetical protein